MKRIASRRRLAAFPMVGLEAENAVLRAYAADTCDDRVSEDIFDVEDEYAKLAMLVKNLNRTLH